MAIYNTNKIGILYLIYPVEYGKKNLCVYYVNQNILEKKI